MAFGYEFVDLNDEQKHIRRALLEHYPFVAFCSALVVFALFQLGFFLAWFTQRGLEYDKPKSPSLNKRAEGKWAWLKKSRHNVVRVKWWMKASVICGWGTRGEWIGGVIWTLWLLYLSFAQTGNDYLHLTKRFGIIGASQLPLHYLLAMRSPYSPIQFLTRMSHEQLKGAHQVLGRIIFFLFVLHAVLYMIFFVLSGFLAKRIKDKDVIFGIFSIILFSILSTTALGQLRRWNYRVFYISHVLIATLVIAALYIHVTHIRPYILGVIVVYIFHGLLRNFSLNVYKGSIRVLPGTNLVRIHIPLEAGNSALTWRPGQHVYLSLPTGKPYTQLELRSLTNPFSVASVPANDKELILVAKVMNGNTKKLADLARSLVSHESDEAPRIPFALEGPYGYSNWLPDFSTFDKILLVAGGVGATYVMPIYRNIISDCNYNHASRPEVRFIWSVRTLADVQWAFLASTDDEVESEQSFSGSVVEVFVTGPSGSGLQIEEPSGEIELAEDDQLLSLEEQMERPRKGTMLKAGRPNIDAIVDEMFGTVERVAVISCGPKGLTDQLSKSVERWVGRGADVYWHKETFGW
ncbi:hypothetical protein CC78DRAFT_494212 [Lojkania enalia]|uniref:ferric-chelate reductase (NADPH) n=1 Tax=Lojkania enalia TaxID=147567 RepID=A0A9P4K8U6_9PLEO|nr:hypothetical protein CC78DRAFT_494212 [Didymosphaeria enalia]